MALIKCAECGHEVSDKAEMCPNCGCPISNESQKHCKECGTLISDDVTACPNCGCPVQTTDIVSIDETNVEPLSSKKGNSKMRFLLTVLLCIAICGCFLLFKNISNTFNDHSSKNQSEAFGGISIPEGKYCIILHNDNYGEFIAPNGGRICGLKMEESDEMIRLDLTKKLTIMGNNTNDLIIFNEYLFSNYSDYLQLQFHNREFLYAPVTKKTSNGTTLFVIDFTDEQIDKQEPKTHQVDFSDDEYTLLYYKDKSGALYGPRGTYLCSLEGSYTENEYRLVKTVDIYDEPIDRLCIYNDHLYKSTYDIIDDQYAHAGDKSKSLAPVNVSEEGDLMIARFPAIQQEPIVFETNQSSNSKSGNKKTTAFSNAKSIEEVRQLINNTTWHYTPNTSDPGEHIGYWFKVSFNDGRYTLYRSYPSDGEWRNKEEGAYEVFEDRFSNTGTRFIGIRLLDEMFNFVLIPSECQISVGFGREKYYGQIEYGDYLWD